MLGRRNRLSWFLEFASRMNSDLEGSRGGHGFSVKYPLSKLICDLEHEWLIDSYLE